VTDDGAGGPLTPTGRRRAPPAAGPAGAALPRPEPSGSDRAAALPRPADLRPSISAPQGGGAVRSLSEKLTVDAATGTCGTSITLPFSPGRSGLLPALHLGYLSWAGNGPLGFGWSLGLPEITRKTDKGLPRYQDGEGSDVFLLAGQDDLVPVLDPVGGRRTLNRTAWGTTFTVAFYRPRVEGLFSRIERWTEQATGISHWRTISRDTSADHLVAQPDGTLAAQARFGPLETITGLPSRSDLSGERLLDLSGSGRLDVADLADPDPGYFERTEDGSFEPLQRFAALSALDWADPNVKFIDVTGDGLADILLTEDGLYTFYASMCGDAGFDTARLARPGWDEEKGPSVVLSDGTQTIFTADMSGDGLSDIVRIRNGEACYGPNIGYGRFGAKGDLVTACKSSDFCGVGAEMSFPGTALIAAPATR
jgi:Salmonella virulence plasmid 65kDa B protein